MRGRTREASEVDRPRANQLGQGSLAGPLATERASGLTGKQSQSSLGGSATPSARHGPRADATNLAEREGGYGSAHGLSETDPAYRMEDSETRR